MGGTSGQRDNSGKKAESPVRHGEEIGGVRWNRGYATRQNIALNYGLI